MNNNVVQFKTGRSQESHKNTYSLALLNKINKLNDNERWAVIQLINAFNACGDPNKEKEICENSGFTECKSLKDTIDFSLTLIRQLKFS